MGAGSPEGYQSDCVSPAGRRLCSDVSHSGLMCSALEHTHACVTQTVASITCSPAPSEKCCAAHKAGIWAAELKTFSPNSFDMKKCMVAYVQSGAICGVSTSLAPKQTTSAGDAPLGMTTQPTRSDVAVSVRHFS